MDDARELSRLIRQLHKKVELLNMVQFTPNYLSLKQACNAYDVSKAFIYKLRKEEKLEIYYVGNKPYINWKDYEKLMTPNG
jgi:hypothetical protein